LPKQQRINAAEAEALLLKNGFQLVRSKGSHRIYMRESTRVVVPFHGARILHPKIVKQLIQAIEVVP
jgi:predicted RNA binding protein YcfA (HicA-like mRNA interferase family)